MTNIKYVENIKGLSEENKNIILNTMEKYGDNKWWLSDDLRTIGYFQLNEEILIVDFSKFHEGIEKLLGRPVWTHEFGLNINNLKLAAEEAWNGIQKTEEQIDKDINNGINTLIEYAEENNKPIIGIIS